MKKITKINTIIIFSVFVSMPSFAQPGIRYYKSKDDGAITKITPEQFDDCDEIYYRASGKEELSNEHKRRLLSALLQGQAKNDLSAVVDALKKNPGSCSYGLESEVFQ